MPAPGERTTEEGEGKWAAAAKNLKAREANRKVASIEKDHPWYEEMPSGKKMPSTPKQGQNPRRFPRNLPRRRVSKSLMKGLGVAKKMTILSLKKQQAYHKQVAKLTQPPLQKKLKTSSKSVKRATSLPQTTYKTAKPPPGSPSGHYPRPIPTTIPTSSVSETFIKHATKTSRSI